MRDYAKILSSLILVQNIRFVTDEIVLITEGLNDAL